MEPFNVYILPSLSAISIKLLILWYGWRAFKKTNLWVWIFFAGLFGVNLIEMISFIYSDVTPEYIALYFLCAYYAFAVLSSGAYAALSLQVARASAKALYYGVVGLIILGVIVSAVPKLGILGTQSIGYSMTRVAGPLYWVLQLIIPLFWVFGFVVLIYAARRGNDWIRKRRATALLIGSLPIVVSVVVVIIFMQAGAEMNATVIVSLAINILIAVLIYTEYDSGIFRFLSFIPNTQEYKLTYEAAKAAYSISPSGLSRIVVKFERALVVDALQKCRGNKTEAAQMLGISRTTLRRKLDGH